ncbi:Aspartate racemase [Pseudomonas reidholzensis]|uniref:Aspartate racemase n=1 Tax=Pseudomonas reidholzensis TaxID=1785162 RepID=A0A383RVU9_9PSED|nr:aspartate/glutamate racemase family protein [Pseudomonas reidholzensis]SYX91189.1 Aspartate racemase [Pseudomonas reidholzensis]
MNSNPARQPTRTLGVIGGLGALAGGDLFYKLLRSQPLLADQGRYHLLFEQHPFRDLELPLEAGARLTSRQLYVFQAGQRFAERGADALLVPCFASQSVLGELQAELPIPILDLFAALEFPLAQRVVDGARLGVLASDYVRASGSFERHFGDRFELVYPSPRSQARLMEAVYGARGIKRGHLEGEVLEQLHQVCLELQAQGATLLLPGMTELSLVASDLQGRGVPLVDANQAYADYASSDLAVPAPMPFKLGVVGGVGPAATVDFIAKVVQETPAGRDQEHLKLVVEQNPQIPDRTANLLHGASDPTVALYATCKRLEDEGAQAIAIPCNTAHAYVERIQGHLRVPIVNMLEETLGYIREHFGEGLPIGLLATSGTLQSRVYHEVAGRLGLVLKVPDDAGQARVMQAIYGECGVKAGFTEGQCRQDLRMAAQQLVEMGVRVLILGCTELPLIQAAGEEVLDGVSVTYVDPTRVLAKRCVKLGLTGR